MRCPSCGTANTEGAAVCANCAVPLTAYAGNESGGLSVETLARLRRVVARPRVVGAMAAADLLAALIGPLRSAVAGFRAQPKLAEDATNYLGTAFGAVSAVLNAAMTLPIALALGVLAWGAWTQRSWAWPANLAVLGLSAILALIALPVSPFVALIRLGVTGALAYFWTRGEAREWFGA
ncbi:MAG: zinc ribbon domain-containing protein [Chthonomonadales bacterium]|nr:zinc ribbon domain-containing protein [Chthonomonadales bacterium]